MTDVRTMSLDDVAARLDGMVVLPDASLMAAAPDFADELLALGETILEVWLAARGETPTTRAIEGFRLLALHRQGTRGDASFNACRETCRELVFHHNLLRLEPAHTDVARRLRLGTMVARHLAAFHRRQARNGRAWRVLLRITATAPARCTGASRRNHMT